MPPRMKYNYRIAGKDVCNKLSEQSLWNPRYASHALMPRPGAFQ